MLFIGQMERLKNGIKQRNNKLENSFENNVFINCPFDSEYFNLLKPLLFTVMACGFNPRIALERFDSGESRIDKIRGLIEESRLSIHDLSRIKSTKKNELFRLNMPYEIGLDFGCKIYHTNTKYREKKSLILEGEKYSCQKALSDIATSLSFNFINGTQHCILLKVEKHFPYS